MKAITLHQPWASAIAVGAKQIETRSWSTKYRGPIAIHAGKHRHKGHLAGQGHSSVWAAVLEPAGYTPGCGAGLSELLPFGYVVATADLVGCVRTELIPLGAIRTIRRHTDAAAGLEEMGPADRLLDSITNTWTEEDLGNFALGRYGFLLEDIQRLEEPVPATGHQGLWNWEEPEHYITFPAEQQP